MTQAMRKALREELDHLLADAHGVPAAERDEWARRLARAAHPASDKAGAGLEAARSYIEEADRWVRQSPSDPGTVATAQVYATLAIAAALTATTTPATEPSGERDGPLVDLPPTITATPFSTWFVASCVQRCGLWDGRGGPDEMVVVAEAVAHTLDEGHETAVQRESSVHYSPAALDTGEDR